MACHSFKRNDSVVGRPCFASPDFLNEKVELSEDDEIYLNELIQHLQNDEDNENESDEDITEDQDDNDEAPPETENDEIFDESMFELLLESSTVTDEVPFNILDIPFMETALINNARAPAKRSAPRTCSTGKKPRSSKVTIVSRITPGKSPNDPYEYRVITLSNGLRAVLLRKPTAPKNSEHREFQEFMDHLTNAKKSEQRFQKEKYLPANFPPSFPLANQPMTQALTKVIEKEVKRMEITKKKKDFASNISWTSSLSLSSKEKLESTFAVVVNVGTCDDPLDCLGLAHFTEHMVHYGSEKYAGEEEYWSFAFNTSTDFNAFTENHTTTYYNTLPIQCLGTAMDMVADMLSTPIFRNDMTCREVHAVDSEFHLSRHLEFLRRRFLFQHALGDHPLAKFDCGNVETLLEPQNIHKVLREFHKKYYVATAMTVGLESSLPFSTQEKLILEHFSNLPQGRREIFRETPPTQEEERITNKCFNMDYVMQGLCTISNLWLAWPVSEEFAKDHANKSLAVLLKVISEEWEGGLAHYLTSEGYIWLMLCNKSHVYSDPVLTENKYTAFVTIDFFLTPKGETHVNDIMQATYSFLTEMVKTPDSKFLQVFHELKLEGERNYNLASGSSLSATSLAKELQRVEPENILKNESWLWRDANYCPNQIRKLLEYLQPTNMIVIQTLPSTIKIREYTKSRQVYIAPYSQAEYVVQAIDKRFGDLEGKRCGKNKKKYDWYILRENCNAQALTVPPPEHYGVIKRQELNLRHTWGVKVLEAAHLGNILGNYHSVCLVEYLNPEVTSTGRKHPFFLSYATSLLWVTSVYLYFIHGLKDHSSDTRFEMTVNEYGIMIGVIGHAEKLPEQIAALNQDFFALPVTAQELNMAKAALLALYDLTVATSAEFIAAELMHFVTCDHSGDVLSDAIAHFKDITVDEVNDFSVAFKSKAVGLVLFAGNLSIDSANEIVDTINKQGHEFASYFPVARLSFAEYFQSQSCHAHTSPMSTGEKCIRIKSDHCYSYTTTVINFYFVGSYEPAKYLLWWNSLYFFGLRAFITLRMKKQLGYHVLAFFPRVERGQPIVIGVGVTSTSANFSACELDKHLDEFMVDYGNYLETVDENYFKCLKKRKVKDQNTLKITMACARQWYQEYFGDTFASDNPNKFHCLGMSKISVQILGHESKPCDDECEKCEQIMGWRRGNFWTHFQFARGNPTEETYFIDDPKKIRTG